MSASSAAYSVAASSGTLSKLICLAPTPQTDLKADALMLEMGLGQLVEAVVRPAGVEVEAHHQRVVIGRDVDPRLGEHHPVIFEVVGDLQHRRILEQRLQLAQHQLGRKLLRARRE